MNDRGERQQRRLDDLTEALERADLRGRGGANFPAATKLHAVAAQPGRAIVVVNAAEGEPLSEKDRYLLTERIDTVLDGALAVAAALDADEIVIAISDQLSDHARLVTRAIESRPGLHSGELEVKVHAIPSGYVSGQETALISALNGRAGKPTLTPPYPFERGLRGRPTLVSNIETFAQIGRISAGDHDDTRLITLSGAIARPGLLDVGPATTLGRVLDTAGGLTESCSAVLLGGYAGTWARLEDVIDQPLHEQTLRAHGLTLGPGILFALGDSACPVAHVAGVTAWMAGQSAGQCGPCVHGLEAISGALGLLTRRGEHPAPAAQLRRWCELVKGRGGCAHPDGVARFVTTALATFAPEFEAHAQRGQCDRCVRVRQAALA